MYPIVLRLEGRRVVVVGGGAVAARRVPALLQAGADVVVVDPSRPRPSSSSPPMAPSDYIGDATNLPTSRTPGWSMRAPTTRR